MSSTSSIWHTKAALASGGMQYCSFCHGLSSFFSVSVERFRTRLARHTPTPPVCQRANESSSEHALLEQVNRPKRSNGPRPLRQSVVVGIHKGNDVPVQRSGSARHIVGAPAQPSLDSYPEPH